MSESFQQLNARSRFIAFLLIVEHLLIYVIFLTRLLLD
jgi:hypothetical protein